MTNEMTYIKALLSDKGRTERQAILDESNLNDREINLLSLRLVHGKSLKDCADILNIEEDSVNKAQLKAVKKLYIFIKSNL